MRTERRAFTLIELMVVITILALLAALLMPMLRGVMEMAREAQCKSGLRNLSAGIHSYAADNNECIPRASTAAYMGILQWDPGWNPVMGANGEQGRIPFLTWQNTLATFKYVSTPDRSKATGPFVCPSDPRQVDRGVLNDYFMPVVVPDYEAVGCVTNGFPGDGGVPASHATGIGVADLCYYWGYYDQSLGEWRPRHPLPAPMPHMTMGRIGDPAGTLMLIEGMGPYHYTWFDGAWVGDPVSNYVSCGSPWYPSTAYTRRHRKGQEALMCDGSARWVQVEDTAGAEYSRIFHANKLSWDTVIYNSDGWPYPTWFANYYGDTWSSSGTLRKATGRGMWSIQVGD